ncbi:hypothetical protein [Mucilaginibacter agri]|uniref:Uncharacterized protein n=1 Tax=Mucilaginibacter agri TaxID=2695265 RepID=A0A965ZG62_9SPHI|nr:hypothetical protein [Mucilaginibacter agri]NCD69151.1 hypothetical protein [Mucilaginibacter agri]
MRSSYFIVFAFIALTACKQTKPHQLSIKKKKTRVQHAYIPAKISGDTLIIRSTSAVFIDPDTIRIEKEKKALGEDDFYAAADDNVYYMSTAEDYLNKHKIKVEHIGDQKFVKFIQSNNSSTLVKVDTLTSIWSLYLFKPTKDPMDLSPVEIEELYKLYFK